ncbi:MAG: hypothetical protein ACYS9X_28120 [Planctomycetota bacterium]|jgi:hypothetical protein
MASGAAVGWSPLAPPPVEELMTRLAWARETIARMREANLRLRKDNVRMRRLLNEKEEPTGPEELMKEFVAEFRRRLAPIMREVGMFAAQHADRVERVLLTLGDGHLYFLFMLRSDHFDWELSDELGDLQGLIIAECPGMPVACSVVPGGFDNERYLSSCQLSELNVPAE